MIEADATAPDSTALAGDGLPVRSMRAAILEAQRRPLLIDEVELPDRLAFGQVLVQVRFTSVCGSQLGEIDGVKGPDRFLPHLLGHEGSGVVVATGAGVKTVEAGDHVVLHWRPGAGVEAAPPVYRWQDRALNAGWVTTFNEYAIVAENRVTSIPRAFDLELAPLLGCAVTTALGAVNNDAQVKIGQSVVVLGAGGVGLGMVQGAAMVSAHPIVAVDLHPSKLELARRLGATHSIDFGEARGPDRLREVLGGEGADAVFENTGRPELIELAYELTSAAGTTVLVGVPPADRPASLPTLPLHFGKRLVGSHGGSSRPEVDIPRYVELALAGKLHLEEMVTDRYGLEDLNRAIADMRAGRVAGRCLISVPR